MSQWERKYADKLVDTILKHIKDNPKLIEANVKLAKIDVSVPVAYTCRVVSGRELPNQY
jgi:hypothetical protein